MSFMFGSPKLPEIKTITPPVIPPAAIPATKPEDIEALKEKEKKKLKKGRERRGTILTSEQGILGAPPVALKTLLGE